MTILIPVIAGFIMGRAMVSLKKVKKILPLIMECTVGLLLFSLGWEVGSDGNLLGSLKETALIAFISALVSLGGSLLASYLYHKGGGDEQ